jgi:hypothetical protein
MVWWSLYEIVMPGESRGIVSIWKDSVSTKTWVKFCANWRHIRRLHQGQWPGAWTTQLAGYSAIYEMRLTVERYQYRPLFVFGFGRTDITFVVMAEEVGDQFIPRNAPARATALRVDVMNKRIKVDELEIDD